VTPGDRQADRTAERMLEFPCPGQRSAETAPARYWVCSVMTKGGTTAGLTPRAFSLLRRGNRDILTP
jgi:hypothetical protein